MLALVVALPAVLDRVTGDAVRTALLVLRWPLLALLILVALAVLYRFAPDRRNPEWRWVSWGARAAAGLWLVASVGFSVYVSLLGNYNKTYGSLGAVIILLLWLYLSALAVLMGAELNAEMERQTTYDTTTGESRPMVRAAPMPPTRSGSRAFRPRISARGRRLPREKAWRYWRSWWRRCSASFSLAWARLASALASCSATSRLAPALSCWASPSASSLPCRSRGRRPLWPFP